MSSTYKPTLKIILLIYYILTQILNVLHKTQYFIFDYSFNIPCDIPFKEHLPEDGHNSWPKHVAGYADYNIINLHIST